MAAYKGMIRAALVAAAACWLAAPALAVAKAKPQVGIDEHLGQVVPMDLTFRSEDGKQVRLGDLIDRPTVVALVYYSCPGICTPLLTGLAEAVNKVKDTPGKDYRVITISFDPEDTPKLAAEKKRNYLHLVNRSFPSDGWTFLTGSQQSIDRITDAIGFRYYEEAGEYVHAGAIYVLSPKGKIVRYLYGTTFLPFDVEMALREASEGRVGPTISRVLLYCFSYDPQGRKYVLQTTRIAGTAMLLTLLVFVVYLGTSSRRRKAPKSVEEGTTDGS